MCPLNCGSGRKQSLAMRGRQWAFVVRVGYKGELGYSILKQPCDGYFKSFGQGDYLKIRNGASALLYFGDG